MARVRLILDIFGQTLGTLWAHKLRSFLTMFGIAWGVGSLLLLVGLGEGFRSGNRKQFDTLGENVMFIWSGRAPVMQGAPNTVSGMCSWRCAASITAAASDNDLPGARSNDSVTAGSCAWWLIAITPLARVTV